MASGGPERSRDSEHRGDGTGKTLPECSQKMKPRLTRCTIANDETSGFLALCPLVALQQNGDISLEFPKKIKNDSFVGPIDLSAPVVIPSPEDIPAYILRDAQEAPEASIGTPAATERPESRAYRKQRLSERISWLEYALANPPSDGASYVVEVGVHPDYGKSVGVHIPVEVVQERIRVALTSITRERDALLAGVRHSPAKRG